MLCFFSGWGKSQQNCLRSNSSHFQTKQEKSRKNSSSLLTAILLLKHLRVFSGKISLVYDIALLRDQKKSEKKLSPLAGKCFLCLRYCAFKRGQKNVEKKKLSLLAGKLSLEKKRSVLLNGVWFWVKICAKSFGGKNFALCNRFIPSKVKVYVWFLARLCSKGQNFFSLWQPYIVKK